MTTIELSNGYFIEIDPLNYTLRQQYTGQTKSGEEKEAIRTHGYYGDISKALRRYIELCQMEILDGERLSLEEYIDLIKTVNKVALHGLKEVLGRFEVK